MWLDTSNIISPETLAEFNREVTRIQQELNEEDHGDYIENDSVD
jgi:hypothetical protein|tara:strand:- start:3603 stop:3734 length:132 start_codon:yes stop_codon:yes gene_type:complete